MTKRERVFNILEGKPVDRPPVGFWLHFPEDTWEGDAAIAAHLDFMEQTDTDILKIMNENLLYQPGTEINRLSDISKFKQFSKTSLPLQKQKETVQGIVEQAANRYPIVSTVHGVLASLYHQTGHAGFYTKKGYGLTLFCRERPEQMKDAMAKTAASLINLVDLSLAAGSDGIFYAVLGGERHFFTEEEYEEFVLPYEKQVFDYIKTQTSFNILHLCKDNIAYSRFQTFEPAIVNWAIFENNLSLSQGQTLFPTSLVLGGFDDRAGVLVDGSKQDMKAHTQSLMTEMKDTPFLIGSDCTLPTEIEYSQIAFVTQALKELTR